MDLDSGGEIVQTKSIAKGALSSQKVSTPTTATMSRIKCDSVENRWVPLGPKVITAKENS
ncbi:hypothetical protein COLO4_34209 [Corchorus olitorius]|uniref:Uncharacterized protein n=1 Tax=Corchorus olitorius TaxID=93759 RepID=A0A1R3GMY6_9ROSI|nr:hypothetical protein COLO4_34209 [Corchorus olitorius]